MIVRSRVYIDMDNVLCDFRKAWLDARKREPHVDFPQSKYGFFLNLEPMKGAIQAVNDLILYHDIWILTAPSVMNPLCYTEKRLWIEKHFGIEMCYRLIISPDKSLFYGDYLIDDIDHDFAGTHIKFGSSEFPDWESVKKALLK
jgi:5'(3')-deoxyribonucleotidase